jgi:phosphopantothenoylcysteine decarboxylase/phosphopantothenate--cysteine ligase
MHPSRLIRGKRSQLLAGRRIILGVSGSIAAIEVPRIARELIRHGADVRAVTSPEASRMVTPEVLAFATGHPPVTQLTGEVEHVTLLGPGEGQADLLLIAPATANTISKIAHGIDDTPVTSFASVALGGGVPILLAPAMHAHMGQNPALKENLARLGRWGVGVIPAQSAEGEDKLASPEEIAAAVLHRLARGPWRGRRVIVVGGASREPIDDVRSLTNESSGETAVALATQAHFRGADVTLWAGALSVPVPAFLPVRRWTSVPDLDREIARSASTLHEADAVIVPAALSDFTLKRQPGKISSRDRPTLDLSLQRAPKILPHLRRVAPPPTLLVGFKLEAGATPDQLEAEARRLVQESGADLIVANDRATLGQPTTNALVVSAKGDRHWLSGPKLEVAGKLLDDLAPLLADRRARPNPRARVGHRTPTRTVRTGRRLARRRSGAPRS